MWGDPGFQSSPLWVLLVLVLYTGLLSLALQFTAGAQSSLGLNKRPHRHEAGEYSLTPVFCPYSADWCTGGSPLAFFIGILVAPSG